MRTAIALGLCLAFASGCFRTHYENFSPSNPNRSSQAPPEKLDRGWQHFFIWGLVPGRITIDARAKCGDTDLVHSIQTQETFLQGLIAAFAGYYVNIYSPYTGQVWCYPPAPAPAAAPAPDPATP